jgi:hypothetical protein
MNLMKRILVALALVAGCGGSMDMPQKKAFGDTCATDADCESGMCRSFQMMTVNKCTKACTMATQAADCPNPPSMGTCNNNGVCRF